MPYIGALFVPPMDLQTKMAIYPGLSKIYRGCRNYVVSTIYSTSIQNDHIQGHHSPCSICLEERNRRVGVNTADDEQRYILKFPARLPDFIATCLNQVIEQAE
jgi:hypothetical protein